MMFVHCGACGHEWDLVLIAPVPLERFALIVRAAAAVGCPKCGRTDVEVSDPHAPRERRRETS